MLVRISGYLLMCFSVALAITLREDIKLPTTLDEMRTFMEQFSLFVRIYAVIVLGYVWFSLKEIDGD